MAESLAVVGIVANIIQLVDFGIKVLKRLEEYQSKVGDIPESFRHIKSELPALLNALEQTKAGFDSGSIEEEHKQALLPAIKGCEEQIKILNELVGKALPLASDSWSRRSSKVFRSLRYDGKVEKITRIIRGYVQTLTYHAATSSMLRTLPGMGTILQINGYMLTILGPNS